MFAISWNYKSETKNYVSNLCATEDLEASYNRCRLAGVPVQLAKPKVILSEIQLIPRLAANAQLLIVAERLVNHIKYSEPHKECIFILCDLELTALKIYASQDILAAAEKVGVVNGTVFTEESCGTNALSLAREHNRVVAIRGEQHYSNIFKNWWCVAGPVKNSEGKLIGYLDISMSAEQELGFAAELLSILLIAIEQESKLFNLDLISMLNKQLSPLPPEIKKLLTIREQEIFRLLLRRLKSEEIAAELNINISTVNTHRKNIYKKIGVNGLDGLLSKFSR